MNYNLVSGTNTRSLHFPADAEVHITGTVTNSTTTWLFPNLAWQLDPLVSASTLGKGKTATIDTTWTNGDTARDLTVTFEQLPGTAASDYQWDLQLSSSGEGCPPPTPQACAKAGGNVFYTEPTIVDGEQREGCYKDATSCIDEIPTELSNTDCDPNDILFQTIDAGPAFLSMLEGGPILVSGVSAAGLTAGARLAILGNPWVAVAAVAAIVVGVVTIEYVIPTLTRQGTDAVDAIPQVVQAVRSRMPNLHLRNPGFTYSAEIDVNLMQALDVCISTLPIDQVIAQASLLGLDPGTIDPASGVATLPGGVTKHVCEMIPTYVLGGATHVSGKPMMSASLHARDVLYGEKNGKNTQPDNPPIPQRQWFVLTRAMKPGQTSTWRSNNPYNCTGDGFADPPTACDEWPWFRTVQGGPGAHLRVINSAENSNGGADYGSFIGASNGCNIQDGQSFAMAPYPAAWIRSGIRSTNLCP